MISRTRFLSVAMAALCACAAPAAAAPITFTAGPSSLPIMENFSTMTPGAKASFDGNDVSVAETFAGLAVIDTGIPGSFESYAGSPTGPLTLAAGAAADGLQSDFTGFVALTAHPPGPGAYQGVVAVLFDYDVVEFGLRMIADSGPGTFYFYGADGSLIDTIIVPVIPSGSYTFSSTVGFRGVAIQSQDPAGAVYADFRFGAAEVPEVPEPSTLLLLGSGALAAIVAHRRARARR